MNVSLALDPATIGFSKLARSAGRCDLDCKEKLFRSLADRRRLRILGTLGQGVGTIEQIAAATGLSQTDVAIELERLVDCGCVTAKRTSRSLLYGLSAPRLLQLEAVVEEFLVASLKAPQVPNYD
jgi:DNA-binding transcriptional ArsR family regulator